MRAVALVVLAAMVPVGCSSYNSGIGAPCSLRSDCDDGLVCKDDPHGTGLSCYPPDVQPDMAASDDGGHFVAPPDLRQLTPCEASLACMIQFQPSDRKARCLDVLSSPDATIVATAFNCVLQQCNNNSTECELDSGGTVKDSVNCLACALTKSECTGPLGKCSKPDGG